MRTPAGNNEVAQTSDSVGTAAYQREVDERFTLANWRNKPFSESAFRNVREVLPTSNVAHNPRSKPFSSDRVELDDVRFEGLDGDKIDLRTCLNQLEADGLLVLHRGVIAWDYYEHGLTASSQHIIFSASKSVAGTLVGILVEAGKLAPDDLVVKYVPEVSGSAYDTATIRHLLDMSVGINFSEDYEDPDGDVARYRRAMAWGVNEKGGLPSPHLREYLGTLKADGSPHGQTFHYASTNTDLLGWVIERACNERYAEVLSRYLWMPMGAEFDANLTLDSYGAARASAGFCASILDLARFGELMRNNGVNEVGQQVVPSWWIEDICSTGHADGCEIGDLAYLFPNGNYRSHWFSPDRSKAAFCALGIHGQAVYVDPETEVVIARMSSQDIPRVVPNDQMWDRACRAICARLSNA